MNRLIMSVVYSPFILLWFLSGTVDAKEVNNFDEYRLCMAEAVRTPDSAYVRAVRWRDLGGGYGADHCAATAMMGMHQYKDAAIRLERLAQTSKTEQEIKAQLLGQAAQAWLLANDPQRAEANASAALSLAPDNVDLLIDRAQAMAARKDYVGVLNDLDKVIGLDPSRDDAFVFRATAKRYLDDLDGALLDIYEALTLNRNHVDGLLERGILHRLSDDPEAARQDWLRVIRLEPSSEAAAVARKNLEHMDVKVQ